MKKLIYAFALMTLILVSCGGEPSIEGKWQIESVSGEELTEHEKSLIVDFQSGGKAISERDGETREGEWKLSDDGKILTMSHDGRDEESTVKELTADKLVLEQGSDEITFSRK